jgi:hypothetical protein
MWYLSYGTPVIDGSMVRILPVFSNQFLNFRELVFMFYILDPDLTQNLRDLRLLEFPVGNKINEMLPCSFKSH